MFNFLCTLAETYCMKWIENDYNCVHMTDLTCCTRGGSNAYAIFVQELDLVEINKAKYIL